jgi:hypothetical protein
MKRLLTQVGTLHDANTHVGVILFESDMQYLDEKQGFANSLLCSSALPCANSSSAGTCSALVWYGDASVRLATATACASVSERGS